MKETNRTRSLIDGVIGSSSRIDSEHFSCCLGESNSVPTNLVRAWNPSSPSRPWTNSLGPQSLMEHPKSVSIFRNSCLFDGAWYLHLAFVWVLELSSVFWGVPSFLYYSLLWSSDPWLVPSSSWSSSRCSSSSSPPPSEVVLSSASIFFSLLFPPKRKSGHIGASIEDWNRSWMFGLLLTTWSQKFQ